MSIPTAGQLRRWVQEAAEPLGHPTKDGYYNVEANIRLANLPHKYGRVVYQEGGAVGVLHDGVYLVARGADHDESIWALAQYMGYVDYGPEVAVEEVSGAEFKTFQTSKVTSDQ